MFGDSEPKELTFMGFPSEEQSIEEGFFGRVSCSAIEPAPPPFLGLPPGEEDLS